MALPPLCQVVGTRLAVVRVLVRGKTGGTRGAGDKKRMKASRTTNSVTTCDGLRTLERRGRTVVALAIRDKTLCASLAARLAAAGDIEALVCPVPDPTPLASWLDQHRADVLLLDERWLHRLDASSTPSLRARWPDLQVLLVGDHACTALAEQVVRYRFQGFLLAKGAADACVKAVRTVKRGEIWVPRALLVELLFEHVRAASHGALQLDADAKLTHREVQIIGYVRRGFANKQIADALAIREDTVKKHLRNAYTKLGVHRRSEIITSSALRLVSG